MTPPRLDLILSPTPLHRLEFASRDLGIELWIKRDDLTGFALGGNKGRKLEFLIADALAKRAEVVVTCGSTQSNFIRQLGAACSRFGLHCAASVMSLPYEESSPEGPGLDASGGNEFLDRLLGVELEAHPDGTWDELYAHSEKLAERFESVGKTVYRIPIGGSSPLGAYSFTRAATELSNQIRTESALSEFDWVVCASSSGSTQTGLTWAFHQTPTKVLGVACDPEPEIVEGFVDLAAGLDALTSKKKGLSSEDFLIDFRFVGPGYGVPSDAGMDALRYLAQREGVFLDPIYSSKAFAGLMARARSKEISGRVLFWHTGGTPAIFALDRSAVHE